MDKSFFEKDAWNVQEVCDMIGEPREWDADSIFISGKDPKDTLPPLYIGESNNDAPLRLVDDQVGGIDFQIRQKDGSYKRTCYLNAVIGLRLLIAWLGLKVHINRFQHVPFDVVKKMADPEQREKLIASELLTHPCGTVRALGKILQELTSE